MHLVRLAFAAVVAALVSSVCHAQVFFANTRVGTVLYAHATVGTTAADAISSSAVGTNILAWKVCADSANGNYLALSTGADPDTDGVRLLAGECFECPNCTPKTLRDLNVKGGAASQGYSVVQYKQQ